MAQEAREYSALPSLEKLITYRLMRLADTVFRAATQVYASRYDVTITEVRVLAIIAAHQPVAANEVSRQTRIDKAWISRSLRALVKRGLVARSSHPGDSRIALLSLTPAGRALVRRMEPLAIARHERLLARLSKAERKTVYRLIDKLQDQADDLMVYPDRGRSESASKVSLTSRRNVSPKPEDRPRERTSPRSPRTTPKIPTVRRDSRASL